jgi:hypothetical protein
MSLEEQLAKLREASVKRHPPERRAIMHGAVDALWKSGAMDRIRKPGEPLPPFSLRNAQDVEIHSGELLAQGPLVLTAFRGVW